MNYSKLSKKDCDNYINRVQKSLIATEISIDLSDDERIDLIGCYQLQLTMLNNRKIELSKNNSQRK